jgi:predicted AAA+ superfamily ATPase
MSLGEFLIAKGNPALAETIAENPSSQNLPSPAHTQANKELREYFFCGGMPQAVLAMTLSKDAESVRRAHRSILQSYRQDFYNNAPRIRGLQKSARL